MKSTGGSSFTATIAAIAYVIYAFGRVPAAGFMLSIALGIVVFTTRESYELSIGAMITTGVVYLLIMRSGYTSLDTFVSGSLEEPVKKHIPTEGFFSGVLSSSFVEGFEEKADDDDDEEDGKNKKDKKKDSAAVSKPADPKKDEGAGSGIKIPDPPAAAAATTSKAKKEAFKNQKGSDPLEEFIKTGVFPSEEKGGNHIDIGTTVVNALSALKPDQVKSMTEDTQKLLETQKSLMGMLSTMKPMLQDGKQMMDTFQEMFGTGGIKI